MGRFAKNIKKYERQFLLALVIILLLTFSIGGALKCQTERGADAQDYSGAFLVSPSRREEIDSDEFRNWWGRLNPYRWSVQTPSLLYGAFLRQRGADRDGWRATWTHALPVSAGRAVGYYCGDDYQIKAAVRDAVEMVMRGMPFNDATYDRFLREIYRHPAKDFEENVREIVIKDLFARPLVETPRFGVSYEEAYATWKKLLERVNLQYVALRGEDFTRAALEQERTRERIGAQLTLLDRVSKTARDLDVLAGRLRAWRDGKDGKLPETLDEVPDARRKDAWGAEVRYQPEGEDFTLRSAGPDGAFDSSDDVTLVTSAQLKTRAALREVGDALRRWHEATSAWPASIDEMRKPPKEGALAALTGEGRDAWDQDLDYGAPAEEGALPTLRSKGPDGVAGNDDDVESVVTADGTLVPPGKAFVPWLLSEDEDVWGRPLRVDLAHALTWQWKVSSAGPDGVFGTEDDLDQGNQAEIEQFYARPEVKNEFEVPEKKDFEAIYVHIPLVPDDALVRLLAAYPKLAPDEEAAFDRWRQLHEYSYYMAQDPTDPEEGHGVALVHRVAPDATPTLVPGEAVFGPPPEGFVGENDPDRKIYVERHWRPILLREAFLENLMNDLLTRARESHDAVKAWEEKKAAFDKGDSTVDPGPRPEEITFQDLLKTELADYLPKEGEPRWLAYFRPEEPLPRADIENLTDLGDINLTLTLQGLKEDGQYAATPDVLNDSHTKAIVHLIKNYPRHDRPLEEIRDVIFDRYVESRRLDLAAAKLEGLKREVEKAEQETAVEPSEGEEGGEEPAPGGKDAWAEALAAWQATLGTPAIVEETGVFIGVRPPHASEPEGDAQDEETARLRRRDYVRTTGYDSIRESLSPGQELTRGMLGKSVLRDDLTDGTESVYLVRLLDVSYPPAAAFSPRDYADYLSVEILGGSKGGRRIGSAAGGTQVTGNLWEGIRHFYYDFEWLRAKFDLDTEVQPERPPEE